MAFSIFTAGTPAGGGNGLIAEGLLQSLALAEQYVAISLTDTVDMFDTPIIYYLGDANGKGSNVLRHRLIGLGWNLEMSATAAEDTDVSASSVSGTYADVTVARRAVRIDESGLAQIVGGDFGFDPQALGQTLVGSFRAGRMTALATAVAGASTNVTSAGTGDIDDLIDCIDTLKVAGYDGPIFSLMKDATAQSIRDSVRSEVGPWQHRPDLQNYLALGAQDLMGVAVFGSSRVTDAASKYENAVMGAGAIGYGIGSPSRVVTNVGNIRPAGIPLVIDLERNASSDTVEIVGNGYDGLAIREQARIVGLLAST